MRILICCLLVLGASATEKLREKRQATYTFPGPRNDAGSRQAQQAYRQSTQGRAVSRNYAEEQDPELYEAPRRQYQPPAQPQQYVQEVRPQAPQPAPVYEAPRPAAQPRQTYTATATTQRKKAAASNRANKYGGSAPQQSLNGNAAVDEVEEGPDPLTLLLEDSKFTCGGKTDGYYADDSVNCHVFHYCVGGARHSWMCPEGTLFHQVHLNCVPEGQDICAQSEKFHFVNDYLYKPVDYDGPNNTARYAQRYYPDGYVVGDAFSTHNQAAPRPQAAPAAQPAYRSQSYPAPAPRPASRPQHRQVAPAPPPPPPPPPTYATQPQSGSYGAQAGSQPHSGYRGQQAARAARPARPTYVAEVQPQQQPQQRYRGNPATPIPHSEPVSDEIYDNEPETRRHATPSRGNAGYAPPQIQRQQLPPSPPSPQQQQQPRYRSAGNPRAVSRAQYPSYASNQAAGVQYDEDY